MVFSAEAPLGGTTGTGFWTFTAANGDQLMATMTGDAEPLPEGFRFTEVLTVSGGTGRFEGTLSLNR